MSHTYTDTLDKLELLDLREQAILLTESIVNLTDDDTKIPHRDTEDTEQLIENDLTERM